MNRALHKMTDAERADEEVFIANVLRAIREEEALDLDEQRHIEELREPTSSLIPLAIILFASAATSVAIAAWLVGVVL